MTPPSQGGKGCRAKLALLVLFGLFMIAQGALPGQTEDAERTQGRCSHTPAIDSGPTDDPQLLRGHQGYEPVPDQQQQACSIAAPPLRGPLCSMERSPLQGRYEHVDPRVAPHHDQRLSTRTGPRVLSMHPDHIHCPGQPTPEVQPSFPCQAGALSGSSKPVSQSVPVPGTSLNSGRTGDTPAPPSIINGVCSHGHFGPSLEPDPGSTDQLAVSDTRGPRPPVSDTRSRRSAAADTERVKRPVSDTSLQDQGASVSDTRTMATASDDDITIYIASAGVQNAEQAAGMPEPWTLPGSNNSRYYDEPQYSQRCETVRAIAQGDRAELVDCRGLRDPHVDNSLHRHLGTHYVNAAANVNQRGFADVLEDLCQAISALFAWAMTQSQTGVYLVLCFLCNSGRHRSVLMAGLLEHFLISRGLHARARHLCSGAWGHMCNRNPPCQACDADWRTARWVNTYQYFEDQFLRLCYKHKFHHSEWWTYFKMPNFPPGGPPGHAMLPPVVPRLEEDARPPRARPATPPPPKTGGITLVDAASRARSQGAPQTARVLEARQQHETAEHRAQSRVRFDEAMAGIGVQNVRHADADAGTAPRGQGTTAKAKAANFAAAHRATVAAAAQRTAQAADPAQGGRASTARGSADLVVCSQHDKGHQGPTPKPQPPYQGQAQETLALKPDPGSGTACRTPSSRRHQGQTLLPTLSISTSRQHTWQSGTRARMPATRARPTHAFASIRVGEASNPGPPSQGGSDARIPS